MERWEEEAMKRQQFVADWARRWRIGPAMDQPAGADWYDGYAGFVGPGWISILDRLASNLIALGWDRHVEQVKEKFAGLRFSIGASTEAMGQRISQAEAESLRTCETCGAPGSRRTNAKGCIRTRCDLCEARERRRER